MAIYLILIAFVLGLSPLQKRMKKTYLVLTLFFVWLIIAFRSYFIGNDTLTYASLFPSLANFPLSLYGNNPVSILFTKNRFEYGYVVFNKLIYHFTENPRWLLIISALIIVLLLGITLYRYSDNPSVAIIIFITMGFMSGSMSQIRQYIAWAICLYSIDSIMKKKPIKFTLLILLAMLFHISAIVFLPMYMLSNIKVSFKKLIVFVVIVLPLFIFFNQFSNFTKIIIKSYGNYSNDILNNGSTGHLAITVNLITFLIFFIIEIYLLNINNKKEIKLDKLNNLNLWMMMCAFVVMLLSYKFSQFNRLTAYFTSSLIFLLPNELVEENRNTIKKVITIGIIFFLISDFVIIHTLRPEWSNITPYYFMTSMWG